MTTHEVGTREQWRAAYERQLAAEKELTRRATELASRPPTTALGSGREAVLVRHHGRPAHARRTVRRPLTADRAALHARAQHSGGLPGVHVRNGQPGRRGAAPGTPGCHVPARVTLAAAGTHRIQASGWAGTSSGCRLAAATSTPTSSSTCTSDATPRLRVGQRQHARRDGADGAELLRACRTASSSTRIRPTIAAPRH